MTSAEKQRRWRERRKARLSAPSLVARVADRRIADRELSPFELTVRTTRAEILADLGGAPELSAAKAMQVDALLELWVVKELTGREVMDLATAGDLIDRRRRKARPVLEDWRKLIDSFAKLLAAVGLARVAAPVDHMALALEEINRRKALEAATPPSSTQAGRVDPGEPGPQGRRRNARQRVTLVTSGPGTGSCWSPGRSWRWPRGSRRPGRTATSIRGSERDGRGPPVSMRAAVRAPLLQRGPDRRGGGGARY